MCLRKASLHQLVNVHATKRVAVLKDRSSQGAVLHRQLLHVCLFVCQSVVAVPAAARQLIGELSMLQAEVPMPANMVLWTKPLNVARQCKAGPKQAR